MKKLLIALAAMGFAGFAQASYLYWQVSSDAVEEFASGSGTYGVQVTYNGAACNIYTTAGSKLADKVVDTGMAQYPGYLVNIAEVLEGSSFLIEIVKWNEGAWDTVGVSSSLAYSDVNQYTVDLGAIAPVLPQAWTGGSYAAPEPTSALLMLIGLAGLALKRRNV